MLRFLQGSGIRAHGIEPDQNKYAFARKKGLDVLNHYIDTNEDDPAITELIGSSDVVSLLNVIEHFAAPGSFV